MVDVRNDGNVSDQFVTNGGLLAAAALLFIVSRIVAERFAKPFCG